MAMLRNFRQPKLAPPAFEGIPARQAFRGSFHMIDRRHLREQCVIEPEGPVTGLLEEVRIVKRQLLLTAAESRAGRGAPASAPSPPCPPIPNCRRASR
jgi:hypothetical protein